MVKIYYSSFDRELSNAAFQDHLALLPESLRQSVMKFMRWEDAHASLFGKLLLRYGLREMGLSDDLSRLQYNQFGRPSISDSVDFNISHSGNYVACALSTSSRIGIDVEKIQAIEINDFTSQFTIQELTQIAKAPDCYYEFYRLWTCKEAVIKALGDGLNIPLKSILITGDNAYVNKQYFSLTQLRIADSYIVHTATFPKGEVFDVQRINFN